jgi:hypothetical protein
VIWSTVAVFSAICTPVSREVWVFLSSTFRDFMQERVRLVKQVFSELRPKARGLGVEMVDSDLCWGIKEKQIRQDR